MVLELWQAPKAPEVPFELEPVTKCRGLGLERRIADAPLPDMMDVAPEPTVVVWMRFVEFAEQVAINGVAALVGNVAEVLVFAEVEQAHDIARARPLLVVDHQAARLRIHCQHLVPVRTDLMQQHVEEEHCVDRADLGGDFGVAKVAAHQF